jgi:predicted phosphodiesterase
VKIACISDTHNLHRFVSLPDCDILVHAGDMTSIGLYEKMEDFDQWCKLLPLDKSRIIVIAGNHDFCMEPGKSRRIYKFKHCTYLFDSFYGSPWQPEFCDWAFNLPRYGKELKDKWHAIPKDTDVLITHGPPYEYGDLCMNGNVGDEVLLGQLKKLNIKLHVCGHIHSGYGLYNFGDTTIVNASVCDEEYKPVNKAIVVELDLNV